MSPEPGFSGNDFTYFLELNNALEKTEPLWYNIPYEHKVNIKSKSVFYWPRAEVAFNPNDSGTVVTIKFNGSMLAIVAYGTFLATFIGILTFLTIQQPTQLSQILPAAVFLVPIAFIPVFFSKIQNNIIKQLQYS